MVDERRTQSALTGRPLRDRMIGRTRQLAGITETLVSSRENDEADLETDVSSSIETINKVTETYAILLDKLSAYELKVRELTRRLSEETNARSDALTAAAVAERTAREAQALAARAETDAARSAETVRELEHQLAALRAQTSKLMDAVDQLFPDLDGAAPEMPRGLRVVR